MMSLDCEIIKYSYIWVEADFCFLRDEINTYARERVIRVVVIGYRVSAHRSLFSPPKYIIHRAYCSNPVGVFLDDQSVTCGASEDQTDPVEGDVLYHIILRMLLFYEA